MVTNVMTASTACMAQLMELQYVGGNHWWGDAGG